MEPNCSVRGVQSQATSDHTTLLLNCYSKLKDIDKLDAFLKRSAGNAATLHFDTEVAVKVSQALVAGQQSSANGSRSERLDCRPALPRTCCPRNSCCSCYPQQLQQAVSCDWPTGGCTSSPASADLIMGCVQVCRAAGLYGQAQWVAQAAGEPLWYLEILVEDCQLYDEALAYLGQLPRALAADAVHRFGQVRALAPGLQLQPADSHRAQHPSEHSSAQRARPTCTAGFRLWPTKCGCRCWSTSAQKPPLPCSCSSVRKATRPSLMQTA